MTRWLLLAAAALLVGASLWVVSEVVEGHRREQARCQHALTKELRWKPWAVTLRLPADPCEALRAVRRGQ